MEIKDIQKKQDELDHETLLCSKCGKEEIWGFIRDWGVCNE